MKYILVLSDSETWETFDSYEPQQQVIQVSDEEYQNLLDGSAEPNDLEGKRNRFAIKLGEPLEVAI